MSAEQTAMTGNVYIWSGEHSAYWRANGAGYTNRITGAGIYTREEAERRTSHCGPEKRIELEPVPADCTAIAAPISSYFKLAQSIVNSDPVLSIFASCEWNELDNDGHEWIAGIVREAIARSGAIELFHALEAFDNWFAGFNPECRVSSMEGRKVVIRARDALTKWKGLTA